MAIRPVNKKILVKKIEHKEQKKGEVLVSTSTSKPPSEGTVLAVAEDCKLRLTENDTVIFNQYAGQFLLDNDEQLLLLDEEEIYGVRV